MKKIINYLKYVSGFIMAAVMFAGFAAADASAQTVHNFSNTSSIEVRDLQTANPYPSAITVSGVPANATRIKVKIKGFTHAYPDDVGVLLVAPDGRKVRLFTDCLGDGGGNGITVPIDLTIDDFAPTALPDNPSGDTPSGTYKPKTGTSDGSSPEHPANFPTPAPAGAYAATMANFYGVNANGMWRLFVDDDGKADAGVIQNGWELSFQTMPPTAGLVVLSGVVNDYAGIISSARLTMMDSAGLETVVYTDLNGRYEFPAVPGGSVYMVSVFAKGRTFTPNIQALTLTEDTVVNWTASS